MIGGTARSTFLFPSKKCTFSVLIILLLNAVLLVRRTTFLELSEGEDDAQYTILQLSASTALRSGSSRCDVNLQSLLFCSILRDLGIVFSDKEIMIFPESHKLQFRNRIFPIMLPIQIVRNCIAKQTATKVDFTHRNISLLWCTTKSVLRSGGENISSEELLTFNFLNEVMTGVKADQASETTHSHLFHFNLNFHHHNVTSSDRLPQRNIDVLMEMHVLNMMDVMFLNKINVLSYGDKLKHNEPCIHLYAWDSNKWPVGNWGDQLGPYITGKLSNQKICLSGVKLTPHKFGATGSIGGLMGIELFWSSGLQGGEPREDATYISVRGPRTQRHCLKYLPKSKWLPVVSGDSALLMPLLYQPKNTTKLHPICLILHYLDMVQSTLMYVPKFFHLMDVKDAHVERFLDELVTCRSVVTTSLHGLIGAHSYGIPGAVIALSDLIKGGSFKYADYYNSLGIYMKEYRTEMKPIQMPQNFSFYKNLIDKTPQPTEENLKESQKKLLRTFPFHIVPNYQLQRDKAK